MALMNNTLTNSVNWVAVKWDSTVNINMLYDNLMDYVNMLYILFIK